MTDLMAAVVSGATRNEVQDLLDAGEDVNARVANGWTALMQNEALAAGESACRELLGF